MIGQNKIVIPTAVLRLQLDPAQMAESAKKPRLNVVGWAGIGLAGLAVWVWLKGRKG